MKIIINTQTSASPEYLNLTTDMAADGEIN